MDVNTTALIASLIAGVSTGIGALPIYFKKEFTKKSLDLGMGFSAGVMLVASFISLILPGLEKAHEIYGKTYGLPVILIGLFAGYFFVIFIHHFIPHRHQYKEEQLASSAKKELSRTTLVVMAISLHNFPEGLTVGVGFGAGDLAGGIALATAISVQNMPEGLVVALSLLSEGASKHKAFAMALLSGMIEPLAALLGFLSTRLTQFALPLSMAFAGGAMLFVICQEMFPEIFRKNHERSSSLGVVTGIAAMLAIDFWLG